MCQATIYLDGKEIMQDVTLVEVLPEGVRLKAFFDTPVILPAIIRQIDLLKHHIIMETIRKGEDDHERSGETANTDPSLDGTQ
jgi:predicted RNA-binding protein